MGVERKGLVVFGEGRGELSRLTQLRGGEQISARFFQPMRRARSASDCSPEKDKSWRQTSCAGWRETTTTTLDVDIARPHSIAQRSTHACLPCAPWRLPYYGHASDEPSPTAHHRDNRLYASADGSLLPPPNHQPMNPLELRALYNSLRTKINLRGVVPLQVASRATALPETVDSHEMKIFYSKEYAYFRHRPATSPELHATPTTSSNSLNSSANISSYLRFLLPTRPG